MQQSFKLTIPYDRKTINYRKRKNGLEFKFVFYKEKRIFNFSSKIQRQALSKINEKLTFHIKTKDLRSTFITRCQEMNIPEFIIQSWVGHKIGSRVTCSVYTKHNDEIDFKYINIYNSKI